MATYLLDTTAFSALVKEHPLAKARLAALEATHRVVICTAVPNPAEDSRVWR